MTPPNHAERTALQRAAIALNDAQYQLACAHVASTPNSTNDDHIRHWHDTCAELFQLVTQLANLNPPPTDQA